MSRISAESFLSLIQQSGLVEPGRLKRELEDLEDQGHNIAEAAVLADSLVERELLTEWQADKLLKGKHRGFTLGKYRLRRLLGKGGMSSVYLAEHILMRRQCAIKVLPIKRVDDTSYLARFHREARAVASLDHPNIVRAYDIDHETEGDKDIHFLVMEYVDGESLHDHVKEKGPLTLDNTAEFFRQAAMGLDNAHKNGLIHRDVKPGNLLIDRSGVVKVLDLGLARFSEVSDDNPLTLAHDEKVLGTADYLAPEQALDSHTADHRADIYGLGCTAYFALTGYPPFREGTLTQRLMFHQTKEPPAIAKVRPEIGNTPRGVELEKIVSRMMAKKPEERFQTMDEVSVAFARWLKIYASPNWRAAHPDAFLKSDAGTSGGAVPVAKAVAVAVPVAQPIVPQAAPAAVIVTEGDVLSQASGSQAAEPQGSPAAQPVAAMPISTDMNSPDKNSIIAEAQPAEPAIDNGADPGFGAFLAGFDGGVEPAAPALTTPEAETVFSPGMEAPVEPTVAAPAEPPMAAPVEIQQGDVSEPQPPLDVEPITEIKVAVPVATPIADPVEPSESVPVAATVVPVAPVEPDASEPEPVERSSEPAFLETGISELEVPENVEDLAGWDDDESAVEPLADFDPSILPEPLGLENGDEYPSLLGGTPTGQKIPGLDDPADVTQSVMEQTQEYVPSGHTPSNAPADATLLNPVEAPSQVNFDIVPSASPVVEAPVDPFAFEPAPGNAPVFPGAPPAAEPPATDAPPFASPVAEQPFVPAAPAAPMFPGMEVPAVPVFDPAAAAPMFAAPVQPAVPVTPTGFAAEQPFGQPVQAQPVQPAFPTDAPSFGMPPVGSGQFAAPGQVPVASVATTKKKPPVAIIAGVVVTLIVGVGAYFMFTGGANDKSTPKKTASSSKSSTKGKGSTASSTTSQTAAGGSGKILGPLVKVGPGGNFSTIGAALDYLKKNKSRYDTGSRRTSCKVEVLGGETYGEAIVVDNSKGAYPPGIQIVSAGVG
ncbi:MAG: protein kinase, partial [Rhodopirellula sp.]|nr:protein kinase [Rhodopirellula sp.]